MFCKQCGKEIKEAEKFCSVCGAPVQSQEIPANNYPQVSKPYGQDTQRTLFGLAEAAVLTLLSIISMIGLFKFPMLTLKYENKKKATSFGYWCFEEGAFGEDILSTIICFLAIICIATSVIMLLVGLIKLRKGTYYSCRTIAFSLIPTLISRLTLFFEIGHLKSVMGGYISKYAHVSGSLIFVIILFAAAFIVSLNLTEKYA